MPLYVFICPSLDECCTFAPMHRHARAVCVFTCGEHSRWFSTWCSKLHLARCHHSCTVLLNTALCCSATTQPVSRSNNAFQNNQFKYTQEGNVLLYSTAFHCFTSPLWEAFCRTSPLYNFFYIIPIWMSVCVGEKWRRKVPSSPWMA